MQKCIRTGEKIGTDGDEKQVIKFTWLKKDFSELLTGTTWCANLAYLAEFFEKLNKINSSL